MTDKNMKLVIVELEKRITREKRVLEYDKSTWKLEDIFYSIVLDNIRDEKKIGEDKVNLIGYNGLIGIPYPYPIWCAFAFSFSMHKHVLPDNNREMKLNDKVIKRFKGHADEHDSRIMYGSNRRIYQRDILRIFEKIRVLYWQMEYCKIRDKS